MLSRLHEARAKRLRGEQGFTLIELLVVVVILGILIAIAVPVYLNYQNNAKKKSVEADVRSSIPVVEECIAENNGAWDCDDLDAVVSDGNTGTISGSSDGYTITVYRTNDDPEYEVKYDSSDGSITKTP